MTQDDVLFGYRLQLFDLAARTTVTHACRTFGVHRSTFYRWKHVVERPDWRCCARGSGAGRRCPTSSRR